VNCKLTQVENLALKDKQRKKERFLTCFFKHARDISSHLVFYLSGCTYCLVLGSF
jgi:hypothetical protein